MSKLSYSLCGYAKLNWLPDRLVSSGLAHSMNATESISQNVKHTKTHKNVTFLTKRGRAEKISAIQFFIFVFPQLYI